jgi:tetratricopeptide (TPR) repeat protein
MLLRREHFRFLCLLAVFFTACSSSPEELAARHTRRGDEYLRNGKFKEAVIEYKNAVKAEPENASLRLKLAGAALSAKDVRTAYQEYQKTVELDPQNFEAMGKLGEIYVLSGKTVEASRIADTLVKRRPQSPEGYILRSGLAVRAGRVDEGIAHLKKAIELDPNAVKPILTVGNLYVLKRDRRNAKEWYDKALAVAPDSAEVHVARGNFLFASGMREEGEREYRKAIELSEKKEDIRIVLAEQFLYQGRVEDSEKELNALIDDGNSQKARKVLAEIKLERGKVEEAKPIVDAILERNNKDLEGKYLKGRIALAEKRFDEAKALFGEVMREDAVMAKAHLFHGMADILQGRIDAGRHEVQEALRLDPGNVRAHLVLGDVYLMTNAPAAAEKEAVEVLRRHPTNLQAAVVYGDSFVLREKWNKAEEVFTTIVKQMPEHPVGYWKMGQLKNRQNKPAEAAEYFSRALERNPKELTVVNEYVFTLVASGKSGDAKKILEDYLGKEPKNHLLWEMKGRFHLAEKKPEEAERAFLTAIELKPDFIRPYYELGVLYMAQKKLPDAESRFRKVVEKNDRSPGTHALLGVVLSSQGKIDEANEHYRRSLDLAPKNALAANNLASNLSDHGGNLDEALKFAQIAREAAPEDPNVADTLGWIYYKKDLIDTAYPLLYDSSQKLPNHPTVRYHHGMVLLKMKRKKEAIAELKAALASDSHFPGREDAKATLAKLAK